MSDLMYGIATEAALALALQHLGDQATLSDARVFTSGNVHVWTGWDDLLEPERIAIGRYVRLRPEALADDRFFLQQAKKACERKVRFVWRADDVADDDWQRGFQNVTGKAADRLVLELLDDLERRRHRRVPGEVTVGVEDSVQLRTYKASFTIPTHHLPHAHPRWPTVITAPAVEAVRISRKQVLDMADRLDGLLNAGGSHHRQVVSALMRDLVVGPDRSPFGSTFDVIAGPTQLLVAPTGGGKTVFARVVALTLAARGTPVAIVVPDIKEVLRETFLLQQYSEKLRLGVRVAPINSAASFVDTVIESLENRPAYDPDAAWTLDQIGYFCKLSGYLDAGELVEGREPCSGLRQARSASKGTVVCPFASGCPKFDPFVAATSAQILVVNHFAFLKGRVPVPIEVDGEVRSRISVMELVLRRCPFVLIDEVDLFQKRTIDETTGTIRLSSQEIVSPLHELLDQLVRWKAAKQLPSEVRVEKVRQLLHIVTALADDLADLINHPGEIEWTQRDMLRWFGSKDAWLAKTLFGERDDAGEDFARLFEDEPFVHNEPAEKLRQVLRDWVTSGLDEDQGLSDFRVTVLKALGQWETAQTRNEQRTQSGLSKIADGLVLRTVLSRLEDGLSQLRPQLATLELHGMDSASAVRDELLGYMSWRPAPSGALGRRVVGFSFRRSIEEPGDLYAQVLTGDPHGFIAGIGDEVAVALTGAPRAVLGLSATARFSGSPNCDVLAPVLAAQRDVTSGITIEDASVAEDGKLLRISGVSKSRGRHGWAARLATCLWERYLCGHLNDLRQHPETAERARVLLVTGSYEEARIVASAISKSLPSPAEAERRVKYVAKDKPVGDKQVVTPKEIEGFGCSDSDVLISPLSIVARGHNILQPGKNLSAIASIFVLVRPIPPADDASRLLAHVSYDARRNLRHDRMPGDVIAGIRRRAEQQLRRIQRSTGPFSSMPKELRHHVLCDVLVELAQLAGRARRGGTDVRLFLVDGAFHDDRVGWANLIQHSVATWKGEGVLDEMMSLHRPFLEALFRFAGISTGDDHGRSRSSNVVSTSA